MNPIDSLGKNFSDIQDSVTHTGIEVVFDDLDHDDAEQEFSVSAKNGSWEFSLGTGQLIEAIFIYRLDDFSDSLGFNSNSPRKEIEKIHGEATAICEQSDYGLLGASGAWERYDNTEYYLHVEHEINSTLIKLVTLMLPSVAP